MGGGKRTVFNIKKINRLVRYHHFKMEGIHALSDILRKGDFMVKIDLKDAFFLIELAEKDRKFMRFQWNGKLYEFRGAPMGLASVPRTFTKLLKPVVALLRSLGMRIIIYLDDLLFLNQDPLELLEQVRIAIPLLKYLGFLINWDKSVWSPGS